MIDVYCDESRQDLLANSSSITDNNRFCCIGGISVPIEHREEIKSEIKALKEKHDVSGELRWGTVSNNKVDFYLDLVDLFFGRQYLIYRPVVRDAAKVQNDVFNNSDQELGYYKFYYQLLNHWLAANDTYRIYTDQKTNKDKKRLKELHRILNCTRGAGTTIDLIKAIDSKESLILQMENILMGAVGYKYNWGHNGASFAKQEVVRRIEHHIGRTIKHTSASEQKFNVFVIVLREGL